MLVAYRARVHVQQYVNTRVFTPSVNIKGVSLSYPTFAGGSYSSPAAPRPISKQ